MTIDLKRVKEIFLEAAELPDEAARTAYLDRACGGDAGLRKRVEALLRSHDPAGSFLGTPAAVVPEPNGSDSGETMALEPTPVPTHDGATPGGSTPGGSTHGGDQNRSKEDDEPDDLQFLASSARPDSLGRLGHYEMLQVLGKGAFGIVFRAFDDMLQRVVAIKVMAPQIATLSPARKRFLREARSSAQVRHENVVQIYEVGEQPLPYLTMEFIPGETLQQKLDRCGPLDVPETLRIGRQIAEGLAAAHACDLIHRDIKPSNVLLEGGSYKAKITDFGLARAADDASLSQSGLIAGTPMYMAPEQALGRKIDQRADLFSFGSVLYQMVSGRPPFRAPSTLAVLRRVTEETPRPIQEIIPETPDWLCGIIMKLHAKDPDERFQSAREVADLLADCEAKLKAKQEVKHVVPTVEPAARTASGGRKRVAAAAVLLLGVVALAVTEFAGVTHLFRGQQARHDPIKPGKESSDADGWVQLFDGSGLDGWKIHPKEKLQGQWWNISFGVLTLKGSVLTHLFSDRGDFRDFHLRIEARCPDNSEATVGVRAPFVIEEWGGVRCLSTGLGTNADTTFRFHRNSKTKGPGLDLKRGDWFTQEWIVKGDFLEIKVNGERVLSTGGLQFPSGHVVLKMPPNDVQFRKIEIKELPPAASADPSTLPPTFKDAVLVMNFEKDTFYQKDGQTYVRDLSARGNDGVCEGAEFTPAGKVGGGLACQAGSLRIPKSLIHGQANYTITGWCQYDASNPAGRLYVSYAPTDDNKRDVIFTIYAAPDGTFLVGAWNKEYAPDSWLLVRTKAEAIPRKGFYFFAVTLKDGDVGKGTLRVTINETSFTLDSQMVQWSNRPEVCDLIGKTMSGGVIDEVAVFQRALSDQEIAAVRALGLQGTPLNAAKASP